MRSANRITPPGGDEPQASATVIPFPTRRMVGRHRMTAAMIAAASPEERADLFCGELSDYRAKLLAIGVQARTATEQMRTLAHAFAIELDRLGCHGGWDGYIRNRGRTL